MMPVVDMLMMFPPELPCFRSIPSARLAILEHRVWANGRRVTHTETALPAGTWRIRVQFGANVYERELVTANLDRTP